ncbi:MULTISPECIES: hypothetical protein [Xanthomonas]|uniref:Uncharacterized protein n=1 Tax=Xanthomonas citri pv. phaseoli var. fuscans TaxID=473423 RepID=A0AB33FCR0_XANCI|nr:MULTISPECIES: hypothetical protein [Xanthomonas]ATS39466.1 hypothetical protein XcfCFBP6988P_16150 [Xanthomonas citri pv. phaseoli var. fuscans]ATS41727.1 hypothetical protein XcfCFBP6989P_04345 [Xanthomonas citri pv. phaseoli var. fuscans]ATS47469.1 hypothetical protein XcfCFBP6990P_13020 [Xanthomonas citri pv. phaseoli var. fuscans]ATS86152.1 hypothetical protein XcfCFBP6991P_21215 [Xanthomonas citri pv. phaseoli var. fuscans]QWN21102.1 hypothetical protein DGM98_14070 [Xanthomonas citri]
MSAILIAFPPARIVRQPPSPAPSRVDAIVAALERLASDPSTAFARRIQQRCATAVGVCQ